MSQAQVIAPPAPAGIAKPKKRPRKAAPAHPKFLDMVKEAIGMLKDRNGSSRQAICKAIVTKYPSVNPDTMNSHVRKALKKGLETGALTRPPRSSAAGATGKFKLGAVTPAKPAKKKAAKKPAKKRPAKKATAKAKPKAKSPGKKKAAGKKKPAGKKATKAKTKRASPKKKAAKPATKKVAKKPKVKKSPTKKAAKK